MRIEGACRECHGTERDDVCDGEDNETLRSFGRNRAAHVMAGGTGGGRLQVSRYGTVGTRSCFEMHVAAAVKLPRIPIWGVTVACSGRKKDSSAHQRRGGVRVGSLAHSPGATRLASRACTVLYRARIWEGGRETERQRDRRWVGSITREELHSGRRARSPGPARLRDLTCAVEIL